MYAGVVFQHGAHPVRYGFHGSLGRSVGQAQRKLRQPHFHTCPVGDGLSAQLGVGHNGEGIGQRADLCAAEGDVLHRTLQRCGADPVSQFKGLFKNNDKAAEKVAGGVLGSQRKRQAAQAQPGNEAVDIVAHLGDDEYSCEQQDHSLVNAFQKPDDGIARAQVKAAARAHKRQLYTFGSPQQSPGQQHDESDTHGVILRGAPCVGVDEIKGQQPYADVQADERNEQSARPDEALQQRGKIGTFNFLRGSGKARADHMLEHTAGDEKTGEPRGADKALHQRVAVLRNIFNGLHSFGQKQYLLLRLRARMCRTQNQPFE